MFGIGWAELLIIAVVATVVVPPRDLPRLMRGFGHSVRKLRHVADDLQHQFEQTMQEGKIEDVRGAMQGMRTANDPPLLPIPADPAEPRRASKPASRPRPSRARVDRRPLREAERARASGESSGGQSRLSRGHGEAAYRDAQSSRRLTPSLAIGANNRRSPSTKAYSRMT